MVGIVGDTGEKGLHGDCVVFEGPAMPSGIGKGQNSMK